MSSTIVADSTEDKDDSLIIIVNADGTITVDPETLQKLIANNHSNNVSLVHVNDPEPSDGRQNSGDTSQINLTVEGFFPPNRTSPNHTLLQDLSDADPGNDVSDPFSHLEPEHLARLESALQSEHAKEILGSKLDDNLTNMLNILEGNDDRPSNNISPGDCHSYTAPPDVHVDHSYHVQPVPAVLHQQSSTVMANKQPPQVAPSRLPASRQLLSGPRVRGRPTRGLRTLGGIARTIIPGQLQTGVITSSVSNQEVSSTKYVVNPGSRPTQVRTLTPVPGTRTLAWLPPRRVPPTSGSQVPLTSVNSSGTVLGPTPRASVPIQSPPRKATTQPPGNISPAPVVSSTTDQKIPVLKKTVSQSVSIPTKIPTTTKPPPKSATPTLAGPTSAHTATTKTTPVLVQKKLTVIKKKPDTPIVENEVINAQVEPEEVAAAAISCKLFRRLPNSRRSRMSMASKLVGATSRGGKINRRGIFGRGGIVRRKERLQKIGESEEKGLAESDATSEEVNSETLTESKVPEIAFPPAPKEVDLSNVTVSPSIMALIQKKTPHVVLTKLENLPGNQITALKSALSEEDLASAPQDPAHSKPSQSPPPSKASSETLTPSLSTATTTAAPEIPLEKSKEDSPLDKVAPLEKNTLSTDSKPIISSVKVSTPANIKTAKSPKKVVSKDVKPASTSEGKKTESPKVSTVRLKTLKEPAPVKSVNIPTPNSTPAKVGATTKSEKAILEEKDKEKKKKEKAKSLTSGPVVLGPELFSTPDIIRRVSTDKPSTIENVTPEKEHPVETRNSVDSDLTPIDTPILTSKESDQTMVASQDNMLAEGAMSDQAQPDNVSKEAVVVMLDSSLVKSQPDSLLNTQPIVTSSTNRKVEVQLVHPPLSGDPITATETLLHNMHSDAAKRDSALLLDDLTNDGVSPMKFEEDVPKVESQMIVTPLNSPLPSVKPSQPTNAQVVVQADGNDRLRRLPPIEVPTTRSATKKAALVSSPQLPKSPIKKPTQPKVVLLANEQKVELVEPITEHRASTESHLSTNSVEKKPILSDSWDSEMDDHGSDVESYNSEDDPNRLWCICQKPHNNRFMICCDGCEDWFHGKCVGITKALGQQMEAQGVEWSCPNCRAAKAKEAQRQNPSKIGVKSPGLNQSTLGSLECITCKKPAKVASNFCSDNCIKKHAVTKITALKKEVPSLCLISKVTVYNKATGKVIVGEKAPTVQKLADWLLTNSGYEVLTPSMSTSSKFGQLFDFNSGSQSEGQPSPKVVVRQTEKSVKPSEKPAKIEKRGSVGSISSQSSVVNKKIEATSSTDAQKEQAVLKQAVLMPKVVKGEIKVGFGSKPGPASKKIQLIQAQPLTPLQIEGPPKTKGKTEDGGKKVSKASTSVPQTPSPTVEKKKEELKAKKERKPKEIDTKLVASGTSSSKSVNSPVVKTPSTPTLASPPTTPLPSKEKTTTSTDKVKEKVATPASEKEETPKQESIRDNVKRMLQETLSQRTSQDPELKTTIEEIRSLVEAIEEELYNFFKDTGVKYRAKFRSLIFNIKDAKNHTLYKKIVEKAVQPSELVRLSPEELASQELAQWREKEAKHQIEMIKKNELALIHQAKTVVLKSRKGEEIIESKNHEASISELESALNRTADDYEEPAVGTKKELDTSILNFSLLNKEKSEKKESEKKEKDRGRKKERKRSHRSRSRGRRRSQSKSKERSHRSTGSSKDGSKRSRSQSQDKSNKKGRSRSKSRTSSKSHGRSRSKSRERTGESKARNDSKSRERSKSRGRSKTRTRSKTRERPKTVSERSQGSADVAEHISENSATSLIDDIGGSLTPPPPVFGSSSDYKSLRDDDLSDREPSSTVFIATPPTPEEKPAVWTGTLNMSEVTALFASAYEVSGSCEDLEFELSDTLECIGRIQPDSVWEYVSRMKKAGTKDIIVIRFQAESELEKINYVSLYSYLSTRNRMAVIGHIFKTVKDFYVMPLASHSPIPQVLLPLDGPGFEETRPHLLLGIIVRNRKGVYGSVPSYGLNSSAPVSKKRHSASTSAAVSSERSYTPPLPDSASGAITPHKVVPPPLPPVSLSPEQEQEDDEEQPYDPGEGQEDIGNQDDEPYSPSSQHTPDIAKNLEEVKKLIEEKKQKIEALIPTIPGIGDTPPPYSSELNVGEDEAYSPPESFTPPPVTSDNSVPFFNTKTLPDIKLPSNLQEILASIKGPQMDPKLDPIVKAYTSQKNLNEEEGSITDDESEKSGSMASDTSHSKSRDPRQRVSKPTSLGQFSDSDLLKKAAEMEYITSGGSGPPPSQVVDSPCAPPNSFYAVPPPPVPPYPPPLPPGMGPFQKAMGGPPGIGMPPILGVQGVPVPPPLPHLPPGHPTGVVPPALKRPQIHFLEGPPQMDGNPPMIDPATRQQLRDMDMRGPGPPLPNWPPEHHSHRSGNAYRREARDTDYRRGNFPYRGGNFDRRSGNGRNAERIPPPPNRIQNEWDEEIRNFEQRRARESGRRKRIRSRSPSSPHRRHRRHGRPSSPPSNL